MKKIILMLAFCFISKSYATEKLTYKEIELAATGTLTKVMQIDYATSTKALELVIEKTIQYDQYPNKVVIPLVNDLVTELKNIKGGATLFPDCHSYAEGAKLLLKLFVGSVKMTMNKEEPNNDILETMNANVAKKKISCFSQLNDLVNKVYP